MRPCHDVILYYLCIAFISYMSVLTASMRKKQMAEKRKRSKEPIHMREVIEGKGIAKKYSLFRVRRCSH
jgi:hypothetical protein